MQFDPRQKATILAALAFYHTHYVDHDPAIVALSTANGAVASMTKAEVGNLREDIQDARVDATSITIPDAAWERTGQIDDDESTRESDDTLESRLLTTIHINGLAMHLEAIQVVNDEEPHPQEASNSAFEEDLQSYQDIQDCSFQTTEIMGREYVLVATPHGD